MSARTEYRVRPAGPVWMIELAGDSQQEVRRSRAEAIARARELAGRAPLGRVVVLNDDDEVEETYDVDPGEKRA